jgi:hypothetical protein
VTAAEVRRMLFGVGVWALALAALIGLIPLTISCAGLLLLTVGLRVGGKPPLVAGIGLLVVAPLIAALGFPGVILDRATVLILLFMLMAIVSFTISEHQRLRQ